MRICLNLFFFILLAGSAGAESPDFKVGVISPLTGKAANIGSAIKNGIQLFESKQQHKHIEYIYEDSQFDNREAVSAFKKLKEIDKVNLVFVFGHGQSHVLAPLAESSKLPLVAVTGEKDVANNRKYVIRFFPPHEWLGSELVNYLRSKGYQRLGMIKSQMSNIENILRGVQGALSDNESLEIVDDYPTDASDFRTSIAKLKTKHFDALGVFVNQGQIGPFYKQLEHAKYSAPTFGTHAFESGTEIKDAGPLIEGAVYPAITVEDDFKKAYKQKFGNDDYVSFAGNAYDFAAITTQMTASLKESSEPQKMISFYKSLDQVDGVSGSYGFKETKEFGSGFIFPVAMKSIHNGQVIVLKADG